MGQWDGSRYGGENIEGEGGLVSIRWLSMYDNADKYQPAPSVTTLPPYHQKRAASSIPGLPPASLTVTLPTLRFLDPKFSRLVCPVFSQLSLVFMIGGASFLFFFSKKSTPRLDQVLP